MKTKHTLLLIALGFCVDFVASFNRIMHHAGADRLFLAGLLLKIAGTFAFVYKVVTYPKTRDFMNW